MLIPYVDPYLYWFPPLPPNCDKPPTLYAILNSMVNYGKDEKTKIRNLAKEGRTKIFDFDYPLSSKVSKETFETTILNHFITRRIGFDTVTTFQLQLEVKLNSIMPLYNKMFDLLEETNFIGDITIKEGTNNRNLENTNNASTTNNLNNTSENNTETTSDRRYSDTPQNELDNIKNGKYVTEYNLDKTNTNSVDESTSQGTSSSQETGQTEENNVYNEKITNVNVLDELSKMKEKINNIYELIFNDLDELFYQLV